MSRQQSVCEVVMLKLPLTSFERRLYYMTAHNHYHAGCPDLSLQVLLDLPPSQYGESSVSLERGANVMI